MRLGIDIGGTKTAVVAVDAAGRVRALRQAASGRGPEAVVTVAVDVAREVMAAPGVEGSVASVGACMPGLVDATTGWVVHALNLGVERLDLRGELSRQLGRPVAVENDVKAAAIGARELVGDATEVMAYLNVGTGLAAAVVDSSGEVMRGIGGAAGEIGHLPVGGDVPCGCGQVGCLETLASGSALARLWPQPDGQLRDPFAAAAAGDEIAARAVETLCEGIGLAIQLLALAAGAEHVVVGGGLTDLGDPLLEGIAAQLRARAARSQLIAGLSLADRFEVLRSDVPVAAVGAALLPRTTTPLVAEGA